MNPILQVYQIITIESLFQLLKFFYPNHIYNLLVFIRPMQSTILLIAYR